MRLFLSIPIPLDLAHATTPAVPLDGFRPVPAGTWHTTLAFFPNANADAIHAAMDGFAADAFEARCTLPGAFPSPAKANVLWLGVDAPGLGALARSVRERTAHLGHDAKPFRAHITLGRFRRPHDVRMLLRRIDVPREPFPVDRIDLMASELAADGAHHVRVASWPLGQPQEPGVGPT